MSLRRYPKHRRKFLFERAPFVMAAHRICNGGMNVNEQVWRTYKAVSEHHSISAAARHLHLSQSAVSQHVRQLEHEYATPLFLRTAQGMVLTDTGDIVYRHVINLLATLEDSRRQVADQLHKVSSSLFIGASLTIAEYILPRALAALSDHHDDITVYMANSHQVLDRVVHRDVDIGLVEAPVTSSQVLVRPFLEDHLKVVMGRQHPWASRSHITLNELVSMPMILREPGSGTRMVLEESLRRAGIGVHQLNVRFVLATTQAIKAMLALNLGISVLSPLTILPHEQSQFRVLSVLDFPLPRTLSIIHHHDLTHATAKALIRVLLDMPWSDDTPIP